MFPFPPPKLSDFRFPNPRPVLSQNDSPFHSGLRLLGWPGLHLLPANSPAGIAGQAPPSGPPSARGPRLILHNSPYISGRRVIPSASSARQSSYQSQPSRCRNGLAQIVRLISRLQGWLALSNHLLLALSSCWFFVGLSRNATSKHRKTSA